MSGRAVRAGRGTSLLEGVAARLSEQAWQVFQGASEQRTSVGEGGGGGRGGGSPFAAVGSVAEDELRSEPAPGGGPSEYGYDVTVADGVRREAPVRTAGALAREGASEPALDRRASFTSILEAGGKRPGPPGERQRLGADAGDGGRSPSAATASLHSPTKSSSGSQGGYRGGSLRPQAAMKALMQHDFVKTQLSRWERRPPLAIHPDSSWRLAWDLFVALVIVYSVVMVPWRIAFESEAQGAWLAVDITADCIFTADIVANFRTGYRNTLGVVTWQRMARHYARRWFAIDLLSVLPIDLIVRLAQGNDQASMDASVTLRATRLLRLFRLLRLLRMLRLLRLGRLYDAINNLPVNRNVVALAGLLMQILFLAHLVGCLWHWNAVMAGDTEATWLVTSGLRDAPPLERYVAAVHWALATMTTVGFGDVKPENSRERGLSMAAMLLGATVFGYNIVSVSELVENLDPRAALFRERLQEVGQYTRERRFPPDLAQRVRDHFRFARARRSLHDEDALVGPMSAPLASALLCGTYGAALADVPFLRDGHAAFAAAVARRLRFAAFPRHVALFRDGDLATELYFVRSGRVEKRLAARSSMQRVPSTHADPTLLGVAGAGAVVGETVILAARRSGGGSSSDVEGGAAAWDGGAPRVEDDPTLTHLRPYSALVLEHAEVLVLSREAATELMVRYRDHMAPMQRLAASAATAVVRARARAMQSPLARALGRWHLLQMATAFDTWFERACTHAADEEREAAKEAAHQPVLRFRPQALAMPPPIPSSHPLKVRWDMYVGVCILYSAVMVPWRLASDTGAEGAGRALDMVVDVTFVIDLLLSFRTTYFEGDAGAEVTDGRRIVAHYLRTWFPIDLASVFPFDLVFQSSSASSLRSTRLLRALRLARLFKLIRMARLRSTAEEHESGLSLSPAVARLLSRFLVMGLAAHLLACAWVAVPDAAAAAGGDWRDTYCTGTAPDGSGDPFCARQFGTGSLYLASFYWGIVVLSTTGYGDIVPASVEGMLVAMLAMLVGAAMFAFVVGGMLSLVMQVDPVARARREERTALDGYLDEQEAPRALHRITRRAFEHVQFRRSAFAEAQLLGEMPDTLRTEAAQFAFRDVTATVPLFAVAEAAFPGIMAVIGPMLSFVRVEEGDRVFVAGRTADTVYFVQHGVMEVAFELGAEDEQELRKGRARAAAGRSRSGRKDILGAFGGTEESGKRQSCCGAALGPGQDDDLSRARGPVSEQWPTAAPWGPAADAPPAGAGAIGDGVLGVGAERGAPRRSSSDGCAPLATGTMRPDGEGGRGMGEAAPDWTALSAVSEEKDWEGAEREGGVGPGSPTTEQAPGTHASAGVDADLKSGGPRACNSGGGHGVSCTDGAERVGEQGDGGSSDRDGEGRGKRDADGGGEASGNGKKGKRSGKSGCEEGGAAEGANVARGGQEGESGDAEGGNAEGRERVGERGVRYMYCPRGGVVSSSGGRQQLRPSLLEAQAVSFDTSASPPPESPALQAWRKRTVPDDDGSSGEASEANLRLLEEGAEKCFGWVPDPDLTEMWSMDRTGTRFFVRGDCLGAPFLCLPPKACVQLRITVKARRRLRRRTGGGKAASDANATTSPTAACRGAHSEAVQRAPARACRRASSMNGRSPLPPLAAQASMEELDVEEHPPEGSFAEQSHVDNTAAAGGVTGKDQLSGRARAVQRAFEGGGGGCAHLIGLSREAFATVHAVAPHVARWMVAALGANHQLNDWLVITEEECNDVARRWPSVEVLRRRQHQHTRMAAEAALISTINEDSTAAATAAARTPGAASASAGSSSGSRTGSSSRGRSRGRNEEAHGSLIRTNTRRLSVVRRGSKHS